MRTRFCVSLLLLSVISIPLYSQVRQDKGTITKAERENAYYNVRASGSVYSATPRQCYVMALGVQGPFRDETLSTLSFPEQDCRSLLTAVESVLHFDYKIHPFSLTGQDQSLRLYRAAFDLLETVKKQEVHRGDLVILYFSGHGLTINGNYFFPLVDSETKYESNMIRGERIMDVAATLANKGANVLLFQDTCQAGGILNEQVKLTGDGGIAIFPASSAGSSTQEWAELGSSPFGARVQNLISGEGFRNYNAGDLTVQTLGNRLALVMAQVQPVYLNSRTSNIEECVLVDRIQRKTAYNDLVSRYNKYSESAKNAFDRKAFHQVMNDLRQMEAFKELGLESRDMIDLSAYWSEVNQAIAKACAYEPVYSKVWESLAAIDDKDEHLDKSVIPMDKFYLGCGKYYRDRNRDLAFDWFMKAYEAGERKEAPQALYEMTENLDLPAGKPISSAQREEFLAVAKQNGYAPKPEHRKNLWEVATEDGITLGGGVVTGLKMYPVGGKVDFFYGFFHLGLAAQAGSRMGNVGFGSQQVITKVDGGLAHTTELVSTEYKNRGGTFALSFTAGLFFKYVSLDCGFGPIWTRADRTDTYKVVYTESSTDPSIHIAAGDERIDVVESFANERFYCYKPGMTILIPLPDYKLMLGGQYRICPACKEMNSLEVSFGLAVSF